MGGHSWHRPTNAVKVEFGGLSCRYFAAGRPSRPTAAAGRRTRSWRSSCRVLGARRLAPLPAGLHARGRDRAGALHRHDAGHEPGQRVRHAGRRRRQRLSAACASSHRAQPPAGLARAPARVFRLTSGSHRSWGAAAQAGCSSNGDASMNCSVPACCIQRCRKLGAQPNKSGRRRRAAPAGAQFRRRPRPLVVMRWRRRGVRGGEEAQVPQQRAKR